MQHRFDRDHACEFGVDAAIVIEAFSYWIYTNRTRELDAEEKPHFRHGHWWTVNTYAALCRFWPYWSEAQIYRVLQKLVRRGVLLREHYSGPYRQCWWGFADEDRFVPKTLRGQPKRPAEEVEK